MDCTVPGSSVHGIFQAKILERVAISSSREIFLTQGLNLGLPHCRQTLYPLTSKPLLCLIFGDQQLPFGPACGGISWCMGIPISVFPSSLGAQAPAQNFSIFSVFMSPSSLLSHFRELSLTPWRPGVFCGCQELALLRVVP